MKEFLDTYLKTFNDSLNSIKITDYNQTALSFDQSLMSLNYKIQKLIEESGKIIMIGNGGSAGICNHQVIDYWKNGKIKSVNFNNSSLLTCISNDFSFEEVFSKPIEMFSESRDIVYCFSSSGKSKNIINAASLAKERNCFVVTFSGFEESNELRKIGDLNYYVESNSYGHVEIIHLLLSHIILDSKLYIHDDIDIYNKNLKFKK